MKVKSLSELNNQIFDTVIKLFGSTFATSLTMVEPTANNTITLPNKSGTIALTSDVSSAITHLGGVRQTVQSASVDTNGLANFVSIGTGLNVNIAGTAKPVVIHAAGGAIASDRKGTISEDKTVLLAASNTSYIYESIDTSGICTSGSTTLAPIYQMFGTPAITAGQFTFNISEMKGYLGNGTTAPQVWVTFTGEAVTNATNVTSVVNYALNGYYDSGYTATLPAASSVTSKNHNIGTNEIKTFYVIENTTINLGFAVGDKLILTNGSSVSGAAYSITFTNKIVTIAVSNSTLSLVPKTGGIAASVTIASWKYKFIVQRGF